MSTPPPGPPSAFAAPCACGPHSVRLRLRPRLPLRPPYTFAPRTPCACGPHSVRLRPALRPFAARTPSVCGSVHVCRRALRTRLRRALRTRLRPRPSVRLPLRPPYTFAPRPPSTFAPRPPYTFAPVPRPRHERRTQGTTLRPVAPSAHRSRLPLGTLSICRSVHVCAAPSVHVCAAPSVHVCALGLLEQRQLTGRRPDEVPDADANQADAPIVQGDSMP